MKSTNTIFLLVIGIFASAVVWINVTEIEEIIRGEGEVSPAEKVQTVQPRFSGKIEKIYVSIGDIVDKDAVVADLNSLDASSQLEENLSTIDVLVAEITRLKAEVNGQDEINWETNLPETLIEVQDALFAVRNDKKSQEEKVLFQEQRLVESRILELEQQIRGLKKLLALKNEEKSILAPLVEDGMEPKTRLIQLKQDIQGFENEIDIRKNNLSSLAIELSKTQAQLAELDKNYRAKSFEDLARKQNQLRLTRTKTQALQERLHETTLRTPIDGIITKIVPKGSGAIVNGGDEIIEVAPFFNNVRVKAKLKPQDITQVREGQNARILLHSYDFTVFGTIDGYVDEIAQNTSESDRGDIYYETWVESRNLKLSKSEIVPEILPGMLAQVEIIGNKRSIFEYLMKPILKTTSRALTEQ